MSSRLCWVYFLYTVVACCVDELLVFVLDRPSTCAAAHAIGVHCFRGISPWYVYTMSHEVCLVPCFSS